MALARSICTNNNQCLFISFKNLPFTVPIWKKILITHTATFYYI